MTAQPIHSKKLPPGLQGDGLICWQVWVEAGREGRIFSYGNPENLPLAPGDLVRVPLRGRRQIGLVVEQLDGLPAELDPGKLLPIEAVHQRAAVDPLWQGLLQQVAVDCHSSLFRTLKTALPPGWLGQLRAAAPLRPRQRQWVEPLAEDVALDPPPPRQRQLLERLRLQPEGAWLQEILTEWGFSRSVVQGLLERSLLRLQSRSGPQRSSPKGLEPPRRLNAAQGQALEAIDSAPPGASLLLWGITGSGKTEVYLQAAAACLVEGASTLMLTPEIGLIPQLLDRCRARFGERVIAYHSGLGEPERIVAWRRCLAADRQAPVVVVGTRSAIFLPLAVLGLIVLDEEHDSSWKQESPMPCYHARTVAQRRAWLSGARLLLGSATPSLESWLACRQELGQPVPPTTLVRLPERISGQRDAPVLVVDMRLELAEGNRRLISRALRGRLDRLRDQDGQAVVLVPRRGYSSFLSCRSCGDVVQCPHCDVALTVHRHRDGHQSLRCHWCGHRQEPSLRCGSCGSTAFKPFGAGTQRVIEQLEKELEGLRLLRFDRDTTRGRDGHRRLLAQFAAGEADVLVGTQMLTKGIDLPRVTLAAVLAADGLLHRPDLRSGEQCLQLLLQLAGRAGRGERPGEVIVQTYSPDHPVIRHLIDGRYDRYLESERLVRQQAGLVPFSRACLLRLAGASATATATAAAALAERIRCPLQEAGWLLVGPAPAPVARVAGRHRWQLLLHGPAGSPLPLPPEAELRAALGGQVSLSIDPDPLAL